MQFSSKVLMSSRGLMHFYRVMSFMVWLYIFVCFDLVYVILQHFSDPVALNCAVVMMLIPLCGLNLTEVKVCVI